MNIVEAEVWFADLIARVNGLKSNIKIGADRAGFDGHASELARYYVALRGLMEALDEALDEVKTPAEKLKTQIIPERFGQEGINTFTTASGYRVMISSTLRASIKTGMKEPALTWLRDHGLGDLITPTVNASTLSAAASKMLEEGRELDAQYFNQFVQNNTSVTKTSK